MLTKNILYQVGVSLNIAQNNLARSQEITSGHYLSQMSMFTSKVDQKCNYIKLELVQTLLQITHLTSKKSYLAFLAQFTSKLGQVGSRFKHY